MLKRDIGIRVVSVRLSVRHTPVLNQNYPYDHAVCTSEERRGSKFFTSTFIPRVSGKSPCDGFKRDGGGLKRRKTQIFDQYIVISQKR